jgi:ATP-dependent DNA ligase
VVFYAFDLLYLNGEVPTRLPLEARRTRLPVVLKNSGVLLSREPGATEQVIAAVQRLGLEDVIAKRRDSCYDAGQRSGAWVKREAR